MDSGMLIILIGHSTIVICKWFVEPINSVSSYLMMGSIRKSVLFQAMSSKYFRA